MAREAPAAATELCEMPREPLASRLAADASWRRMAPEAKWAFDQAPFLFRAAVRVRAWLRMRPGYGIASNATRVHARCARARA